MKFKAFFAYIGLGAAFLAVSLWVFLSRGKSAKAIGAKYKLGGLMLTMWALLSASTCNGPGPQVTCYEPAIEEPLCYDVAVERNIVILESDVLRRGHEVRLTIQDPIYDTFLLQLQDENEKMLQEVTVTREEQEQEIAVSFQLKADLPAGKAVLQVFGCNGEEKYSITRLPVTLE